MAQARGSRATRPEKARRGRGDAEGKDEFGCSAQEALFVLEYLKDRNGSQAMVRAGYAAANAAAQATRTSSAAT
jgi:hypothetical protein